MKLSPEDIKYINNVVTTAQLVGIDSMIIEPDVVRAIDEAKTVLILQTEDVPEFVFGSIGLNRVATYMSRYDIAKTQDNFVVEAVTDDNSEFVRSLTMKGKGVKIDYRCANPTTITAPKKLRDEAQFAIQLNGEAVMLYQKGLAAMGSDVVTIISNDGVSFEFADNNADVFSHQFAKDVEVLEGGIVANFAHKYPAKVLGALFKHNPTGTFTIGKAGTLSMDVNGLSVTILPRA